MSNHLDGLLLIEKNWFLKSIYKDLRPALWKVFLKQSRTPGEEIAIRLANEKDIPEADFGGKLPKLNGEKSSVPPCGFGLLVKDIHNNPIGKFLKLQNSKIDASEI